MSHQLMQLPYSDRELEPYISSETIEFHYNKHHRTYLNNLNNLVDVLPDGHTFKSLNLHDLVLKTHNDEGNVAIFNNAAQVWNHDFYWLSLSKPNAMAIQQYPQLYSLIKKNFTSFDDFKKEFINVGLAQFGSGWVWLVQNSVGDKLSIVRTSNASTPILYGQKPLITCDVWEHAYYIDYRNRRVEYLEVFLNHLVNWAFAEKNLML